MFTLTKTVTFEAAHDLPAHDGKCARLHGHSWKATVELRGEHLQEAGPKIGMLADYYDIGARLKQLVDSHLDHFYLNNTTGLVNPTSENLAWWIFQQLKPALPLLVAVTVEETCTSSARYEP